MSSKYGRFAGAAMLSASVLLAQPAFAAETITLTFVSGFPPAATFVGAFVNGYVTAVDEALAKSGKYRIQWNLAHSGQIAKPRGELEAVQQQLGDMASIPTAFHLDRVPLHKVPYATPFTTSSPEQVGSTILALAKDFPELNKAWTALNQRELGLTANVDNYVLISKSSLKTLGDLRGKKVGAAGPNLPWLSGTGAAGVSTNLADAYNSLNTGIYDAMIAWGQAMGGFKLCEPAPYTLDAGLGAASMHSLTINNQTWEKLPAEVRDILAAKAMTWSDAQIKLLVDGGKSGIELCKKDYKLVYSEMDAAERKKWAMSLPPLALDWAKDADAAGLPGKRFLTAYMDSMRAAKQPVARHWDRE